MVAMSLASLALAACGSDNGTAPIVLASLAVMSGEEQEVTVGGAQSEPLVVRVLDQFDNPVGGVFVQWEVAEGEGLLTASTGFTDADGQAQTTFISGVTAGDAVVTATVADLDPVSFNLMVVAAP
jgi:hypothetical protein